MKKKKKRLAEKTPPQKTQAEEAFPQEFSAEENASLATPAILPTEPCAPAAEPADLGDPATLDAPVTTPSDPVAGPLDDAGVAALLALLASLSLDECNHLTTAFTALLHALHAKGEASLPAADLRTAEESDDATAEIRIEVAVPSEKNDDLAPTIEEDLANPEKNNRSVEDPFLSAARSEAAAMIEARLEEAACEASARRARAAHRRILPPVSPYRETTPPPATGRSAPRDLDEARRAATAFFRFSR